MADAVKDILQFFDQHSGGLALLWTFLGAAATALLFLLKRFVTYLLGDRRNMPTESTSVTVDVDSLRMLIALSRTSDRETDRTRKSELRNAAETLSGFRDDLQPVVELTSALFPPTLDVRRFVPGKLLVVKVLITRGERGCLAAFCLFHWTVLLGVLVNWLLGYIVPQEIALAGAIFAGVIGFFCWMHLVRVGPYFRFNFEKKTTTYVSASAATWGVGFPSVELNTVFEDNQWVAAARIGLKDIAKSASKATREDAEMPLLPFVTALNWNLGHAIRLANGVLLEPPRQETQPAKRSSWKNLRRASGRKPAE